jgi:hypothetical protein
MRATIPRGLVIAAALMVPHVALAHDPTYVDELNIKSGKQWFSGQVNKIGDNAVGKVEDVLSAAAIAVLDGVMDAYLPGLSAAIGLGGGGDPFATHVEAIMRQNHMFATELASRLDALKNQLDTNRAAEVQAAFETAQDMIIDYSAGVDWDGKAARQDSLHAALETLESVSNDIQQYVLLSPSEASISLLHLHVAAMALAIQVDGEYQRLTTVVSEHKKANVGGSINDWYASVATDPVKKAALDDKVELAMSVVYRNLLGTYGTGTNIGSGALGFYKKLANDNVMRKLTDGWFSPLTQVGSCWDKNYDPSFNLAPVLGNPGNWDENCACTKGSTWDILTFSNNTVTTCSGAIKPTWYYYAYPPNAKCLIPNAGGDAECNRFWTWDTMLTSTSGRYGFVGTMDDELGHYPSLNGATELYNEHRLRVYQAYIERVYAPIVPFLDKFWTLAGNSGSRIKTRLDTDLGFSINTAAYTPKTSVSAGSDVLGGVPMDFENFPGMSAAMMTAIQGVVISMPPGI